MIDEFRKKMKSEGRSLKWFHEKHIKNVLSSYQYFIMQLSGNATMHDAVEKKIKAFLRS